MERPLCKCHDEPMVMSGHWRCRVQRRASQRKAQARFCRTTRGYLQERRWRLRKERSLVLEQLTNLGKEPT